MTDSQNNQATEAQSIQGVTDRNIQIQRIYTKDLSFEAPNLPQIFDQPWNPELKFSINTEANELPDNNYEIAITLSIETILLNEDPSIKDQTTAFICEVTQAGIFTITGYQDFDLAHTLNAQCPNILFPYARETVSNLVNKGGFPPLNLTPVNFEQLFMNYLEQQTQQQEQA
ncbi:MAG: protein-export chaperone SecB [Psittacicella sp.]